MRKSNIEKKQARKDFAKFFRIIGIVFYLLITILGIKIMNIYLIAFSITIIITIMTLEYWLTNQQDKEDRGHL